MKYKILNHSYSSKIFFKLWHYETWYFTEILDERDLGFEEMDDEDFKQEYEDPHLRKISANGIKIEKVYD